MIVLSQIILNNPQIDGRAIVREIHTDDQGNTYPIDYIADKGSDVSAALAKHADQINQRLLLAAAAIIPNAQSAVDNDQSRISQDQQQLATDQAILTAVITPHPIGPGQSDEG